MVCVCKAAVPWHSIVKDAQWCNTQNKIGNLRDLQITNTVHMNKYKLKIKCFIHKKYNCRLHDLFSEKSMWSTTFTTTAPSPLKIGSLVQLNEVEIAVYPISFELITSKHSYHLYWNTFSAVISKFFGKIGIVLQHFSRVKYSASRVNPWQQQYI